MSKSIVQRGKEGVREALARSVASGQRSSFLLLTGRQAGSRAAAAGEERMRRSEGEKERGEKSEHIRLNHVVMRN